MEAVLSGGGPHQLLDHYTYHCRSLMDDIISKLESESGSAISHSAEESLELAKVTRVGNRQITDI
jgi:hypothetical protein